MAESIALGVEMNVYYTIERDERVDEGGELIVVAEFDTIEAATAVWDKMDPFPIYTHWLAERDRDNPDYCASLWSLPEEAHPLHGIAEMIEEAQKRKH